MVKYPPLSTGKENRKRFNFVLNDRDFEERTHEFVTTTTAANTQKCIKFYWVCLLEGVVCIGVG